MNAAPSLVGAEVTPGSYAGVSPGIDWRAAAVARGRGRLWRRLHGKRWHYAGIFTDEVVVALAIVDLGWTSSAFAYLFDRRERRLRADLSRLGLPGGARVAERPSPDAVTSFGRWRIARSGPRGWRVEAHARGFLIDATLDEPDTAPTLCAVATIDGGVANCTHKTLCVTARGTAAAGGASFALDGGFASLDHTHGLLARDTRWKWASATGARVGFNLVEGFNGPVENALWIDGALHSVGRAEMTFDAARPLEPWRIRTVDGAIDVTFHPEGARGEHKQLVVAMSRYVQPIGVFRGKVRAPGSTHTMDVELAGVTEDHVARW